MYRDNSVHRVTNFGGIGKCPINSSKWPHSLVSVRLPPFSFWLPAPDYLTVSRIGLTTTSTRFRDLDFPSSSCAHPQSRSRGFCFLVNLSKILKRYQRLCGGIILRLISQPRPQSSSVKVISTVPFLIIPSDYALSWSIVFRFCLSLLGQPLKLAHPSPFGFQLSNPLSYSLRNPSSPLLTVGVHLFLLLHLRYRIWSPLCLVLGVFGLCVFHRVSFSRPFVAAVSQTISRSKMVHYPPPSSI